MSGTLRECQHSTHRDTVYVKRQFGVYVSALDERLQQLSARNTVITPRNNLNLLDELTAQQERNQLALMQLQKQMHALNKPRCVQIYNQ